MRCLALALFIPLAACGGGGASHSAAAPSHADVIADESQLLRLNLTPQAQHRLGIQTVKVVEASVVSTRQAAGEIVVPPTVAGGVPTGSSSNLQQIGAQQAIADGDVARARAQAALARTAFARADRLVQEEAGSVRARDEAAAAAATAEASLNVALAQRRLLGPPVSALASQSQLWVISTDLAAVHESAAVTVRSLGGGGVAREARRVQAVPSANVTAGTVDLFYALSNRGGVFQVGERVAVDLPLDGRTSGLSVPSAAILRDIYGGEWVYQKTATNIFVRKRVEVRSEAGGRALLARGLTPGAAIVTDGAAELFGTEFGAAH